jgi:chemotaxis protein MotB
MIENETEVVEEGAPEWMVTFADLMSLLLTFFVLLLSFSNMEIIKFRTMAGSVRNALGLKSDFDLAEVPMGNKLLPFEDPKEGEGETGETGANRLREDLQQMLRDQGLVGKASVEITPRGVSLQVYGDLLFDSGKADLSEAALPVLDRLGSYIQQINHFVDVQGHADPVPIATAIYPSNWELSAARAGRTVRYLVDRGIPAERLRAIGLADTVPVVSNETADGRAQNRRVEFLFITPSPVSPGDTRDQPRQELEKDE